MVLRVLLLLCDELMLVVMFRWCLVCRFGFVLFVDVLCGLVADVGWVGCRLLMMGCGVMVGLRLVCYGCYCV